MGWAADRRQTFEGIATTAHNSTDWPSLFILHDPRMRNLVTLWAWCEANREAFRPRAEGRGWKWTTARRAVLRGLEMIADGLNRDVARSQASSPT